MRILIYGINYAPELTGIGKYTGEMAAWLAQRGHGVTVVTAMPYYPEWSVHPAYKKKLWHKEEMDGVRIYRCPIYVPSRVTAMKRIIHEFSFLLSALPVTILNLFQKKYDIVMTISPPFHLGALPYLYTKIRRAALITHVQDLQVDAAKELGMIRNQAFLNILFRAEKFLLDRSTVISTISEGMKKKIAKKHVIPPLLMFPNWVDVDFIRPYKKSDTLFGQFGFNEDDRIVLYSGNIGEKQGIEIILDLAESFSSNKKIYFLVIGNGGERERLENLAKERFLEQVRFYALQPYAKMPRLLGMADIHLVLQKKSASDLVMPSKLVAILAAGAFPLVTAAPGTGLYRLVHNHQLGFCVEPENLARLIEATRMALETDLVGYRNRARAYAVQHLSKEVILSKWEKQMEEIIASPNR